MNKMLVRTKNVPTELDIYYKLMVGKESLLGEIADTLNEEMNEDYYFLSDLNKELYNGYIESYGYDDILRQEEVFENKKENSIINGVKVEQNMSDFEMHVLASEGYDIK